MITKDNIAEVLKHNQVETFKISLYWDNIVFNYGEDCQLVIGLDNPNLISIIESHLGRKLKPLPKPSPFDVVKIGQWIRSKNTVLASDRRQGTFRTENKWYQRIESLNKLVFSYIDDNLGRKDSISQNEWDLTDIRDYNPDEEIVLKVGDEIIFGPINYKDKIIEFDHDSKLILLDYSALRFDQVNTIKSVNGRQGKYSIPLFNFEQTLLDAGFKRSGEGSMLLMNNKSYPCFSHIAILKYDDAYHVSYTKIKPTPANAKCLIDAAGILKGLELAS